MNTASGAPPAAVPHIALRPGLALAAVILAVYGGLALSVDFPRAAIGIQSDEATYYMMGHSLAEDGDLTYRREDLVRVWREFPGGPSGVFLKKGRDIVSGGMMRRPPFFWTTTRSDPTPDRYFYGKSFAYPLVAAPFVKLFGTNGFLLLNALLMAVAALCAYVFLQARTPPAVAAILAGGFIMVSVVPVYYVWIAPELFNFTLGLVAYFCWLFKEVSPPAAARRGTRWLSGPRSDMAAALLLGVATFSKVTNVLLFPPIVLWLLWRRRWRRALEVSLVFSIVALGLFAINTAVSGEWNYQGGERRTFSYEFPLQTADSSFGVGAPKARDEGLWDIILNPATFLPNLTHNLAYMFVGRYSGIVAYFFPAVFAMLAFMAGLRRRPLWQFLVLGAGVGHLIFFIVTTPYTWNGGGGSVGNRYFMGAYGLFVFLLPPITRVGVAIVPWIVGGLFVAPMVLNPFVSSFYPGSYAASGPLRLLPVELTLVYDWPINTDRDRVVVWFGDNPGERDPGFQLYFFDRNAHGKEVDKSFWVKGESRAEFLIKTDRPMRRMILTLTAGAVPTEVTATIAGRTQEVSLGAGASQQIQFALPAGFRYQGQWPVWTGSVSSSAGFAPLLAEPPSTDTRYLGVRVKPMLVE